MSERKPDWNDRLQTGQEFARGFRSSTRWTLAASVAVILLIGAYFFGKAASLAESRGELGNAAKSTLPAPTDTQLAQAGYETAESSVYGAGFLPSATVRTQISQFQEAEETCRGGSGDDPATTTACNRRDGLLRQLNQANVCLGRQDQAEFEYRWHDCGPNSLRLAGSNEDATARYVDDVRYNGPYRIVGAPGTITPIADWMTFDEQCRGAYGGRSNDACKKRDEQGLEVNRKGYCLGTIDDASAKDARWHTCGPRSRYFTTADGLRGQPEKEDTTVSGM